MLDFSTASIRFSSGYFIAGGAGMRGVGGRLGQRRRENKRDTSPDPRRTTIPALPSAPCGRTASPSVRPLRAPLGISSADWGLTRQTTARRQCLTFVKERVWRGKDAPNKSGTWEEWQNTLVVRSADNKTVRMALRSNNSRPPQEKFQPRLQLGTGRSWFAGNWVVFVTRFPQ